MYCDTAGYCYSTTVNSGALLGMLLVVLVISILLFIVPLWIVFRKAGKPGWAAIVPIYNLVVAAQVAGYSGWLAILGVIPYVNVVYWIMVSLGLSKRFGHGGGFAVGLIFLGPIFLWILAAGSSRYLGAAPAQAFAQPGYGYPGQQPMPQGYGMPQQPGWQQAQAMPPQGAPLPPAHQAQAPQAPPQYSPDGRHYWDGAQWIPVPQQQ